jgi:hypothetical protein
MSSELPNNVETCFADTDTLREDGQSLAINVDIREMP